jgi:TetR/AcrR family transcriptional regulator, regulator of cefoperazone and chloramphenicol sensitivity
MPYNSIVNDMSVLGDETVLASVEDLSTSARIRNAALELFARRGVEATSVRAIAQAAGVSPGLVQHYFPTKADLREAVDQYVVKVTATAFADLPREDTTSSGRVEAIGRRITSLFRERALGQRYVARGLIDRDERALAIFDAVVELVESLVREDMRDGRIAADVDTTWAALHPVVYLFGVVLLEHAINRRLPEPIRSEDGLERMHRANSSLYRDGLYLVDRDDDGSTAS